MKGLQLKGASIYVVRGSPKSRRKEENQLICDSAKGGGDGVKKSEIFADIIYGSPLMLNVIAERDVLWRCHFASHPRNLHSFCRSFRYI